jgi:hypothetical protein
MTDKFLVAKTTRFEKVPKVMCTLGQFVTEHSWLNKKVKKYRKKFQM